MSAFISFTVIGIVAGCIYALTASGLVVTYTTSGIFNFAHGAIGMISAFVYWQLSVGWHWPAALALLFVLFVLAPLFGAIVERVLIRPLHGAPVDLTLVVTLGLLLALIGTANLVWKPTAIRELPPFFPGKSVAVAGFNVSYHQIVVVIVAIVVAGGLAYFFNRTRLGVAMRAVVDNPDLVAMAGGRPIRVQQFAWAMGASLAALAGIMLAPITRLEILQLTLLVISGYAAAMVGRLKSLPLTIMGALILGLAENYAVAYLPGGFLSRIRLVIPMALLFVVLIILPQDRLRTATFTKHRAPTPASLKTSLGWAVAFVIGVFVISRNLSVNNLATGARGLALGIILLSLVLLTGYAGLVSLCQMTFVGLGAFAMSHLGHHGSVLGLVAATLLSAAAGALIALPTLRLRGLYLALATLAFAEAMDIVFFTQLLGSGGSITVDRVKIPGIPTQSDRAFFVFLGVLFAIAAVVLLAVRRGPIGRQLSALDSSPAACATLGVNTNWTKLAVFTVSAAMAGFGGALFAAVPGTVSNNDFVLLLSLTLLLLVRVGGITTITGALMGAMIFAFFPVLQSHYHPLANATYLLTGLGALTVGRDPNGMGGRISEIAEMFRERRRPRTTTAEPGPTPMRESMEEVGLAHAGR